MRKFLVVLSLFLVAALSPNISLAQTTTDANAGVPYCLCTGPGIAEGGVCAANTDACTALCNGQQGCSCAQGDPSCASQKSYPIQSPFGNATPQQIIGRFITILTGISGSVALVMFVYGGFQFFTSGGDSKKIGAGIETMKWAAIGLLFMFSAYLIVRFVFRVFANTP